MLEPRDLIGVVIDTYSEKVSDDKEDLPLRYLITGVLGEGAEAVVFDVTDADSPGRVHFALKMPKPLFWLELPVLHSSFSLHPDYVVGHKLNISNEVRIKMIYEYSIERIKNARYEFYVPIFRKLMIEMLQQFWIQCTRVESANGDEYSPLFKNPILIRRIDENFGKFLEQKIEDDEVADGALHFLERLSMAFPDLIKRRQCDHNCLPYSSVPAYNLIGLSQTGMLSVDEIRSVATAVLSAEPVSEAQMETLFDFLVFVVKLGEAFFLAKEESIVFGGSCIAKAKAISELREVAISTCSTIEAASTYLSCSDNNKWLGLSCLWRGRIVDGLGDDDPAALASCQRALQYLDRDAYPEDRHDALMLAARLCANTDEELAKKYLQELLNIRNQLGVR